MFNEEFNSVFQQFYPALVHYAYMLVKDRSIAEDLVSDVFLTLLKRRKQSDLIRPYMYRAVHNACIDYHKISARKFPFLDEVQEERTGIELKEEAILQTELYRKLHGALDALPRQCATIMKMSYIEGKRAREIAAILNISKANVDSQKYRGIRLLREVIKKDVMPVVLFILFLL